MIHYVTPTAEQERLALDAVIFDMDGVLLDITQSIRQVNCLAVPFYLQNILGWPAPDNLITSADIEMFKHAGGFNDDWDLTYALVLHYICKGHTHPHASSETLKILPPSLARFATLIKDRGGWLHSAEEICFEKLTREDRLAIEADYRKQKIKQCFQELMAGEYCERLYGFEPEMYTGPGYINQDRPLLDLTKLPSDKILGVQTGRTFEEARLGMEFTSLDTAIPETAIITKRNGFHKPEPGGLRLLVKRLGFKRAIYIGDTLDDLRTVRNFNDAVPGVSFLGALVLTGPAGEANRRIFEKAGADIVASDVNAVLDWIKG